MRLTILDRGHPFRTRALLALIRLVSRQPVVDAVKLAMYRRDFYGGGELTHEAMRGPSDWSIGDRELMAAFVAMVNECEFCVRAHSTTASIWHGDPARVSATLVDLDQAPIDQSLRATLHMLHKLSRYQSVNVDDMRAVLGADVSPQQVQDALAVCLAFNITTRLADAFGFRLASPAAMDAGAKYLLARGYR